MILRARDGNSPAFQADLHGSFVLRGFFGAVLLLAAAPILAMVFAGGPTMGTYALLCAVPLLRGLTHLDFRRAERGFRYRPLAVVEGGARLAMASAVLPAVAVTGDHRAMAWVLIVHAAGFAILSRSVANRRYQIRLSAASLSRIWRFGSPLMVNALLMFLTFYADRLIVAGAYGWATLALYGVVLQLALLSAQIVGRAAGSLVLPRLRTALAQGRMDAIWAPLVTANAALAALLVLGFAVLAPPVIAGVYGAAFRPDAALALAMGLAAGFRVLRTPFSQLAVATARTGDPAHANLIRALALIPAAMAAALGLPLTAIAAAAALGEAGATLRAWHLTLPHHPDRQARFA